MARIIWLYLCLCLFDREVKCEEIQCCSEVFVSGGYEFREKSKTIDLARRFQRDSLQLPKYGRYYHSHVVYRGALYLLGGFSMKGPTNEVQVIHHARQQGWQNTFRMERSRGFFQAAVFQDRIWACGGKNETAFIRDCESYAPGDGWRSEPPLMEDRFDHSSAVTKAGIYIFGAKRGMRRPGMSDQTTYSVEFYPAATAADGGSFNPMWQPGPQLPEPLYGMSTVTFMDNIYLFGGLHITSRTERRREVLVLKPGHEEWLVLGEMNTPRSRAVIINFGYQLFIIGGCDSGCAAEQFTPALGRSSTYSQYIKIDGSFSEAGTPWPWSCSAELCQKVYTPEQVSILSQVDYTTTLPTMPTLFLMDQTTEVPELAMETTPPSRSLIETTPPDLLYFETTEAWNGGLSTIGDSYFMTTKPDIDVLYDMIAPTTPPPTIDMLFEETEPTFLEVINKTRISFTTKSPKIDLVEKLKGCTDGNMSLLCNMINRPSPFDEKEMDHVKQPAVGVPPPLQPLLSTLTSKKVSATIPPESTQLTTTQMATATPAQSTTRTTTSTTRMSQTSLLHDHNHQTLLESQINSSADEVETISATHQPVTSETVQMNPKKLSTIPPRIINSNSSTRAETTKSRKSNSSSKTASPCTITLISYFTFLLVFV